MAISITGVDVRVLVHELETRVVGAWIVNIYHLPSGIFIFKLRKTEEGNLFLLVEPGKRLHITQFNRMMPKEPSNFCTSLRKHIRDKRINTISQVGLDRIVELNIGPDEGYTLVIELFGQGNMILVSPLNKITTAIWYRKMRDRDIHPGKPFERMPSLDRDLITNGTDGLDEALQASPKVIPALSKWMGLGPTYAKFLLDMAGISKKKVADLEPVERGLITTNAVQLRTNLMAHDYQISVYLEQDEMTETMDEDTLQVGYDEQWQDGDLPFKPEEVIAIWPWPNPAIADEDVRLFEPESLNEAHDVFFSSTETHHDLGEETEEMETVVDRLKRLEQQQRQHQADLQRESLQLRAMGDALYFNFQQADELISTIYSARKKNMSWEDIEERLEAGKEKGMAAAKLLKELKVDEAKLVLELPNEDKLVTTVVDFRKSLTDNANEFYTKAKKSQKKATNADIAIQRTMEKIATAVADHSQLKASLKKTTPVLKRRKAWYEKFHWAHTPDNYLIIAGYDATTNERLVKRYLDPDDVFIHADINGAAATIIKAEGRKVNDAAKLIAAKLSVVYSSAWKGGRMNADAFAVDPEQVSLSAPSGEYLPKGSFMIYGEKEFITNLDLELYIGIVIEKNWVRLVAGTKDCLENSQIYVKLLPGNVLRGQAAKQIKERFRRMVEEEDADKVAALDSSEIAFMLPGDVKFDSWSA